MKLKIEKWFERANVGRGVEPLFVDAVKCYKAEAYRAALLFSYLGFMTALKERIAGAEKPANYPEGQWKQLNFDILNDDKWEKAVFDATQQTGNKDPNKLKDPVFAIHDGLRTEIKYWKDRRNDCAHAKSNEITGFHVDAFWSFLEGKLSKITVEGGMYALLNRIERHYDPVYTPAGEDVTHLISQISSTVDLKDLPTFWNEALRRVAQAPDAWYRDWLSIFINKILALQNTDLDETLIAYLKQNQRQPLLLRHLKHTPGFITRLDYTLEEVREFWMTKLSQCNNKLAIYAAMLASDMIPAGQLEEAHKVAISGLREYTEEPGEHYALQNAGFGRAIETIAFEQKEIDNWQWAHDRYQLLTAFVEKYALSEQVVERLCEIYSTKTHQRLGRSLEALFRRNASKKAEFVAIVQARAWDLPEFLPSLAD
ncbi:hypothetical protein [Hymenobacter negativus]|uniref:Uncharacterized protein n=1 Tax=Hymenobacter negativus TaxID=2795026 RepID=A0ABS3Q8M0_9BACT|nr:hypothetical protein [Hymenobacter negativus]MBO2007587.1 hypothetical protein [Hymenobacter negativus]